MSNSTAPNNPKSSIVNAKNFREYTAARISLQRVGASLTTRHALEFAVDHAQARDAVHSVLAVASVFAALRERHLPALSVCSAAANRTEYLRRPDLGRVLAASSAVALAGNPGAPLMRSHGVSDKSDPKSTTLAVILADGLSALATERHAIPVLEALLRLLDPTWRLTPIVVAEQARVGLGDAIGQALHADATVILLGERPGLSSPDSLGAYITWAPRPGRADAERNCVSNIHGDGLDYSTAAARIAWYLIEGRRLGLTGVALRSEQSTGLAPLVESK